jgi:hypothetical protein
VILLFSEKKRGKERGKKNTANAKILVTRLHFGSTLVPQGLARNQKKSYTWLHWLHKQRRLKSRLKNLNYRSPYPAGSQTQGILCPLCDSFKVPKLLTFTFLYFMVYQYVHHSKQKQADYSGYREVL